MKVLVFGSFLSLLIVVVSSLSVEDVENDILGILPDPVCTLCKTVVGQVEERVFHKTTPELIEIIEDIASSVCLRLYEWNPDIYGYPVDESVCDGLVEEFTPEVAYILGQSLLSPESVCVYINKCPKPEPVNWTVTFPNVTKPPVEKPPVVSSEDPRYLILHLTDFHLDPLYTPHRTTNCGEPVCCRYHNKYDNTSKGSGIWGDYRGCDLPIHTLVNMLEYISTNFPNIDYVMYTGDSPYHVVWNTSPKKNLVISELIWSLIEFYLPNTQWIPAIGNHESSPVNMYPPPGVSTGPNSIQWLYDGMAEIWGHHLPESALESFRYAGYYSLNVDDKLTAIVLNMNFGDSENWWLLVDAVDPAGMLQWLVDQLNQCEQQGKKVILVGHQSPDRELPVFSRNFFDIVYRYESTIISQFYGHSHKDEFVTFIDPSNKKRGFNIAYIAGSASTYTFLNVGFRLYEMDIRTKYLTDIYTYIFNLTEANAPVGNTTEGSPPVDGTTEGSVGKPRWYREYSSRETYHFQNSVISAQDWANATVQMLHNDQMWNDYRAYYTKSYDLENDCWGECRRHNACQLRTAIPDREDLFC